MIHGFPTQVGSAKWHVPAELLYVFARACADQVQGRNKPHRDEEVTAVTQLDRSPLPQHLHTAYSAVPPYVLASLISLDVLR
jgi:hypothetical protein